MVFKCPTLSSHFVWQMLLLKNNRRRFLSSVIKLVYIRGTRRHQFKMESYFRRWLRGTRFALELVISNYWMRLSRIWRILQVEEGVIHRGQRPRWITFSEICRILHILRKPNSIIALLFIQNIFKLLNKENLVEQREFSEYICPSFFLALVLNFRKTAANSTVVVGFLMSFSLS